MAIFTNLLLGALLFTIPSFSSLLTTIPNPLAPQVEITLTNISYWHSTAFSRPGDIGAGVGRILFNISSPQISNASCGALDSWNGGDEDAYFKDVVPIFYQCGRQANFTFTRFFNQITVNGTWTGSPISGSVPIHTASAIGNVTFDCKSETLFRNDWNVTQYRVYSNWEKTCKGEDLKMSIDRVTTH